MWERVYLSGHFPYLYIGIPKKLGVQLPYSLNSRSEALGSPATS